MGRWRQAQRPQVRSNHRVVPAQHRRKATPNDMRLRIEAAEARSHRKGRAACIMAFDSLEHMKHSPAGFAPRPQMRRGVRGMVIWLLLA